MHTYEAIDNTRSFSYYIRYPFQMSMPKFSECVAQKFAFPLPLVLKGEKNSLHFLYIKKMYV